MNLFDLKTLPLHQELVDVLMENETVRMERILSAGQTTDWYDQEEGEYVFLLEGKSVIQYQDGEKIPLKKGDMLYLPPHKIHRVIKTSVNPVCIWLCIFMKEKGENRE